MTAFDELMAFQRQTEALAEVRGRLDWDQQTVMPRGAGAQRSEEIAAVEEILHARQIDPRISDWLNAIDEAELDAVGQAQVRRIRRTHDRIARIPARLWSEIARTASVSHDVWAEARAAEDFDAFAPVLAQILGLVREAGEAVADGGDVYDALLEEYEPGATAKSVTDLFGALRPRLVALRERALGADRPAPRLSGAFGEAAQLALSSELALAFGYDLRRGRIDKAVHPFSSGSGLDVRITTRTQPNDPFNCFYSTIHEVGHATYEQAVDDRFALTPIGQGVSMGVHESQSRLYENQLGRSRAFTGWLFGRMRETFGEIGVDDADGFFAAVNRVHPGFIRTEADEVHYNLHVLLRFDLERALIAGDLAVSDLPGAWDERFEKDFGVAVDKPSNGCLQDVHWAVGLFGYFPTYTLGNVYAGCLHAALRRDLPDLDQSLAAGDPSPATGWLRENVQRHGALREPRETVAHACGFEPSEAPLLDYLEAKFGALYGV